jgi:hypothetical protein
MKTNTIKQLVIVLICSLGLYFSGPNLAIMSGVQSLLDALNVMVFFTCFFPFTFVSLSLFGKIFKSFVNLTTQKI